MRSQVRVLLSPPCGPGSHIEDLCNGSTPDSDSVCGGSNPSSSAKKSGYPFGYPDFFIQSRGIRTHLNPSALWALGAASSKTGCHLTFRLPAERQSNPSSSALNSTCMRRKRIVAGGNPKRGHTSLRIVRYTKKTATPSRRGRCPHRPEPEYPCTSAGRCGHRPLRVLNWLSE